MVNSSCIIYYPLCSIWSSYGLIKCKYFFIKKIKSQEDDLFNIKITDEDYFFVK